ncbi:FtsK/SpoIIIE domain-containing protein [Arthrobacter sp. YAF16]|uniref:FtsK/SpoIIIE domain-containing protein n=1 Tax=Arthrobacter sp. YAF16 TaxID=3233076 RepID=UPI003F910F19
MLLQCTLVRGPVAAQPGMPVELSIELPAGCPGAELESALARKYGTVRLTVDGSPLDALTAGNAPLVNGAVLIDGAGAGPASDGGSVSGAALLLAVLSGPGAGTVLQLRRGRYLLGRAGTELVLPDPELSREHARLEVTDSAVTLVDLGSANGTTVDGRPVKSGRVTSDSVIGCGQSTLGLVFRGGRAGRCGDGAGGAGAGSAEAGTDTTEALRIPNPGSPANRAVLLLTAVLPLAVGAALAVATGMWMFLAFSAVSGVAVLVPALSGRRRRRELKAAVATAADADRDRRRRAAPSAAALVTDAGPPESRGAAEVEPGPVWLRLGLAPGRARILLDPDDPGFSAPPVGPVPVCLDPSAPTELRGPADSLAGLIRFLVMQLASYPRAGRTRVLLHGPAASLPLAARFLARVSLSASDSMTAAHLAAGPGPDCDRGVLIIVADTGGASALCAAATPNGWQVLCCSAAEQTGAGRQSVVLGERRAFLFSGTAKTAFAPDLVPEDVFDRFCRNRRQHESATDSETGQIPDDCRLADFLPLSAADVKQRWESVGRSLMRGLSVPVGRAASGPLHVDLQADGPHLLVAGTTGSGKSEFLRTLVAGLAASYPPDLVNLLFVDFKGGSGLGPLTGLPHCVGMLTDLSSHEVERTLASLRAEVRHREELLAAGGVPDLTAYQAHALDTAQAPALPALPHLVLVIDEFRMLVEEAPAALRELMRIATIGRSLGIHLVMATQRPQGALNADIRANVTSSIVLRVQSELESSDVMNSRLAAAIPLGSPGRAYLVRGSGRPEEFQTAALAAPSPPAGTVVTVTEAATLLQRRPAGLQPRTDRAVAPNPQQDVSRLVRLTSRLWAEDGGALPRRPIAEPLAGSLPLPRHAAGPAAAGPARGLLLGMLDVPEEQRLRELRWCPLGHGHLALVGGARGGTPAGPAGALSLTVDRLLDSAAESHLYILDADGSLRGAAASPRVGAWTGAHELRRAVRVLERLGEEIRNRLAAPRTADTPALVLVLNNWGSWVSAFRADPLAWAEDIVHDIIRDGPAAGIAAVVSGERELVAARFFAALPNRIFFPAGSTEETRHGWPRLPDIPSIPGRVAVAGPFAEASPHAAQLYGPADATSRPRTTVPLSERPTARPFRVEPLPARVTVAEVRARIGPESPQQAPPAKGVRLWIGVGGDELEPVGVPLPPASVLAVLGGPASGKTSLVRALPDLNPFADWLPPAVGSDPARQWSAVLERARTGQLDHAAIVVVDDADLLGLDANLRLSELNSLGWTVVLTAGYSPAIQQRVPLTLQARGQGSGILIGPRKLMDGDLLGVRFEPEPSPPPGRALVVVNGRTSAVQLAVAEPP